MPSLRDTRFLILDVETTGLNPQEDRIVQIALVSVHCGRVAQLGVTLVNPERPIPPRASAIHHITNRQVEHAPPWSVLWPHVEQYLFGADVIVAHNAVFDRSFLPSVNKPWLCTKRLAQRLWPSAPNFKNQTLRYWLDLELDAQAHDAAGDALVTAHVLIRELAAYLEQGGKDDLNALLRLVDRQIEVRAIP
ncbi:MAG: 3'-5' exonuclease [Bacilli bacterium]